MEKYVYLFNEGNKNMKSLLGGKGANLAEMVNIGLPVPFGFTITTDACRKYYNDNKSLNHRIVEEILNALNVLEEKTKKKFGDNKNPLLVSVRSGASISMPGMMDTVLNLGLNDETVLGLINKTNDPKFAYDSYKRFIQMYGDVVLGIPKYKFDMIVEKVTKNEEVSIENLKEIIKEFKDLIKYEKGMEFPQEPREQLLNTIIAVFNSWNNHRAIIYRKLNNISDDIKTAVNIQAMVFGNMGENSGTGVCFTRNPSNGKKELFGEFLLNAQGEDVVAGIRTPKSINELSKIFPELYQELIDITKKLENHYKDMQDIEFTIENRKLFILQTRNGKRTAKASVNIAVDMVEEGIITKKEAVMRINHNDIEKLLHPTFDEKDLEKASIIAKGLPASPGAASGKIYFNAEDVLSAVKRNEKAILVRVETSPEDIEGMINALGILTARGGMTSHAAVVARGMGKCCIAGCGEININEEEKIFKVGSRVYKEGDFISLDGSNGIVYEGSIKLKPTEFSEKFKRIMKWADEFRTIKVLANAETKKDALNAIKLGAEGIGLCRTEHMFFDENRINIVREMIISSSFDDRKKALDKLFPFQKQDFYEIFSIMEERPVTIRLLDPPLHEFLPNKDNEIEVISKELGISFDKLKEKIENLKEVNPMLGHRGCRLAITYPEIYIMQTEAIINAAIDVNIEKNINIIPEIMIPLVGDYKEFEIIKNIVSETCKKVISEREVNIKYKIGTMIEVPRAALTADKIAIHAEFFSYGTNDLTQMTYAFSRDDSGKFIREYKEKNIFINDPFVSLDIDGVGKLIKISIELGKSTRPDLKLGLCGEQGGDPNTIEFLNDIGLNYISVSPFRVPIVRLISAKVNIKSSF